MKREPHKNPAACAREMGAEFQANPGSSRREYLDSAAYYFGWDTYAEMPADAKLVCMNAFLDGVNAERALQ